MRKNLAKTAVLICFATVPFFYNNCSPAHDSGSGDFSSAQFSGSGKCVQILKDSFSAGIHPVLNSKCVSCHVPGGQGNGQFATADLDTAFNSFMTKGIDKVYEFGSNPNHKPPYSGAETGKLLEGPKADFEAAEEEYATCIQQQGGGDGGVGGSVPTFATPTIYTKAKPIPADASTEKVIEFNLATDMKAGAVPNTILRFTVKSYVTSTNITGYDFSNPVLVVAGASGATYVKNMVVQFNGTLVPLPSGSTFQNIDRYVAAGTTRSLYPTGAMRIVADISKPNTLALAFEDIEFDSTVSFTPATYTNLTANNPQNGITNVFKTRCESCHNATTREGNISLTANDYAINALTQTFLPYKPDESLIWLSVKSGAMPPNVTLPPAEQEFIRGWIMDGAPK